jgi:hypothetical protein
MKKHNLNNKIDYREAKNWYRYAHQYCNLLSHRSGYPLRSCIGALVSLSAQKKWELNKEQAKQIILGRKVTGFHSKQQIKSAQRILNGEDPLEVWGKTSLKYREFYKCISYPNSAHHVCIDSIMIRWYKKRYPYSKLQKVSKERIFSSRALYNIIQDRVRLIAKRNRILPSECQAIIWSIERITAPSGGNINNGPVAATGIIRT